MGKETESHDLPARLSLRSTNWWETANRWWTFAIKGVLGLAAILTFAVITNLFYEALFKRSIVIEPISVPKGMEEKGYTRDVAALRLLDALNKYVVQARTSGAGPKLALHKDLADFALPNVGLSFKTVVAQIRALLPISGNQIISGEITRIDGKLRLRLLKNEVVIHETYEGVDEKDPKAIQTLFDDAALGVFAATRPYFEAIANSEKNPEVAFELAKRIVADRQSGEDVQSGEGEDASWARNLLGLLLHRRGKLDEKNDGAVAEFKRVIHDPSLWDHDPRLAIAHLNLGLAYKEQGDAQSAISEFRSAIVIRPELGTAHLKLGDVLKQMGEAKEAECEYLEAIAKFHQDVVSDPLSAVAHQRLGDALNNYEEAANCVSYNKSVLTHPHDMLNYRHDRRVLKNVVDYDSAMAEYQRAAERDPDDAHFHYDLGVGWLKRGEVDKAIDELRDALGRRDGSDDSFDEFKYLLLKKLSQALYIKTRSGKDKEITDNGKATLDDLEAEGLFYQAVEANEALISRIERKALVDKKANEDAAAYGRRGADLYLMGKFGEAVAAYKRALAIDKTYFADKVDRGYARFALGNERAAEDFNGAANDFDDAADDFNRAAEFTSAPIDAIIWRYLSREHSRIVLRNKYYQQKVHKEELGNASRLLGSNHEDWRIKLFKDKLPDDVLKPDDVLRNVKETDEQCRVYFYIGEWHALREEREAVEWLKRAERTCPFDLVERPAATAELKRVKEELKRLEPFPGGAMGASPGISTDRRRSPR